MQPSSAQRGAPSMIVMVLVGQRSAHWPQLMQVGSAKNSEVDRGFSSFSVNLDSTMPRGLRCSARTCSRAAMRFAEAQLLALREREVEVLVLVGRADVDEQVVRCARDGLRRRERIAGAGEVEDHEPPFRLYAFSIPSRACANDDPLQPKAVTMFHVKHLYV